MYFCYWDKQDHSQINAFLKEWRTEFPDFRVLGDADIEPLITKFFPQHLDLYRRIRIPAAKADVARLLALYEFGGLYVDCHCSIRDAKELRGLLTLLERYEIILFDLERYKEPRPVGKIRPLNSMIIVRPKSEIIWAIAQKAMVNLDAQRQAELDSGFVPYHIPDLCGPSHFGEVILEPNMDAMRLKPIYEKKIGFVYTDTGPIRRYVHHRTYHTVETHWDEREKHELLFRQ